MDALHSLLEGAGIGKVVRGSRGRRVSIELAPGPKTAEHKEHFGVSDEDPRRGASPPKRKNLKTIHKNAR